MIRGLTIALAVSLGLNLFTLGAVATLLVLRERIAHAPAVMAAAAPATAAPAPAAPANPSPAQVLRSLSLDDREALTAAIGVRQPKLVPLRKQAREARIEAADLLTQPKVDRAALDAAMAKVRAAEVTQRGENEEAVVEVAAGLSPEDRAKIADVIRPKPQN